jgi:hypothetical protein
LIKNRRSNAPKSAARKVSTADKTVAKGRANRQATANARRGINTENKPSAMEVEREINRQAKMSANNRAGTPKKDAQPAKTAQRTRRVADVKTKAKNDVKKQETKQQEKQKNAPAIPPTWIGGTRRPPSVKAVTAAISAMESNGFKVPKGMQMVISFAPAPESYPAPTKSTTSKNNNSNGNKGGNKPPQQQNTEGQGGSARKPRGGRGRGKKA